MIAMTADLSARSLGEVMKDVRGVLSKHRPPPGIRLEVAGQYAGTRHRRSQTGGAAV